MMVALLFASLFVGSLALYLYDELLLPTFPLVSYSFYEAILE